jgi:hypothetical protein
VTASGEYLIANSHKNSDLFWALRGGGGGTYGVLISVTYITYPDVSFTGSFFTATSTSLATVTKLVVEFIRIHPALSDAGWAGYSSFNSSGLQFFHLAPNKSSTAPVLDFFSFAANLSSEGLGIGANLTASYPSYYSWYNMIFSTSSSEVGTTSEIASRLISRDLIVNDYEKVADTFLNLQTKGAAW